MLELRPEVELTPSEGVTGIRSTSETEFTASFVIPNGGDVELRESSVHAETVGPPRIPAVCVRHAGIERVVEYGCVMFNGAGVRPGRRTCLSRVCRKLVRRETTRRLIGEVSVNDVQVNRLCG